METGQEHTDVAAALTKPLAGFQLEALEARDHYFLAGRKRRGVVCLPAGAGKTLLAGVWLLPRFIPLLGRPHAGAGVIAFPKPLIRE